MNSKVALSLLQTHFRLRFGVIYSFRLHFSPLSVLEANLSPLKTHFRCISFISIFIWNPKTLISVFYSNSNPTFSPFSKFPASKRLKSHWLLLKSLIYSKLLAIFNDLFNPFLSDYLYWIELLSDDSRMLNNQNHENDKKLQFARPDKQLLKILKSKYAGSVLGYHRKFTIFRSTMGHIKIWFNSHDTSCRWSGKIICPGRYGDWW